MWVAGKRTRARGRVGRAPGGAIGDACLGRRGAAVPLPGGMSQAPAHPARLRHRLVQPHARGGRHPAVRRREGGDVLWEAEDVSLYMRLRPTSTPVPARVPQPLWPVMVPGYASGGTCSGNAPAPQAGGPVRQWWRRAPAAPPQSPAAPLPAAPWQEVVAAGAPVLDVRKAIPETDAPRLPARMDAGTPAGGAPSAESVAHWTDPAPAYVPPADPAERMAESARADQPAYGATPASTAPGSAPKPAGPPAAETAECEVARRCADSTVDDAPVAESIALALPAEPPIVVRGVERPTPYPNLPATVVHPPVAPATAWRWAAAPVPISVQGPAVQASAPAPPPPDWLTSLGWPLAPAPTAVPAAAIPAPAPAAASPAVAPAVEAPAPEPPAPATPSPTPVVAAAPTTPAPTPAPRGSMRRWWQTQRAEAAALRAAALGRGIAGVLGRLVRRRVVITLPWRRHTGIVIRVSREFVTLAISGHKTAFIRVTSILTVEVR